MLEGCQRGTMPIRLATCIGYLYIYSKQHIQKQEAFEKCWAHSPLRAVLHCHLPGVATVARRLRIDVHDNDDNDNA